MTIDIKIDKNYLTDYTAIQDDITIKNQRNIVIGTTQLGDFILSPNFGLPLKELLGNEVSLQNFCFDANSKFVDTYIKQFQQDKDIIELYIDSISE
jgi:hypothetical protein